MPPKRDEPEYENTGRDDRYLVDDDAGADPYGVPAPMASSPNWQKPAAEAHPAPQPGAPAAAANRAADVAVGDEAYAEAVADKDPLGEMYVKKAKLGEVGSGRLTINEGLSGLVPDPKPPRARMIVGLVVAAAALAGVASLFVVTRAYVDENLQETRMPLAKWLLVSMKADRDASARQKLTADDRAYLITRSRLLDLYPAVFDYYRAHGEFPRRVADLKSEGLLEDDRLLRDGWESAVRVETASSGDPMVASPGADRSFGSADDVRYAGGEFVAPPRYEDADAIPFVEQ